MKIALDTTGTVDGFHEVCDTVARQDGVQGVLVLSCADNGFSPATLDPVLAGLSTPVLGGLFPGILRDKSVYTRGTLAVGLPTPPTLQLIEGLSQNRDHFDDAIDGSLFGELSGGTMFVLVDGMSLHVNSLLSSVFNVIGLGMGYLGGGASSLDFEQSPCILTNRGLKQDCAILAHVPLDSGVGVAHGMQSVRGPFKVTGASFNTISTIDWQPAAKLYRDVLSEHPEHSTEKPSFLGTDSHFSLGLNRFQAERVILEPVQAAPDESLVFMQEVREGEFVDIMHTRPANFIRSAEESLSEAIDDLGDKGPPRTIITFDCVSRQIFLGERFVEELEAICTANVPHVGALTCGGEIGTSGRDFLDYHNRTCVCGAFGK